MKIVLKYLGSILYAIILGFLLTIGLKFLYVKALLMSSSETIWLIALFMIFGTFLFPIPGLLAIPLAYLNKESNPRWIISSVILGLLALNLMTCPFFVAIDFGMREIFVSIGFVVITLILFGVMIYSSSGND